MSVSYSAHDSSNDDVDNKISDIEKKEMKIQIRLELLNQSLMNPELEIDFFL